MPHLDPLTEQQLLVIGNLRLSSRQAEEALSQGLEQLHRSLADTVTGGSLSDGVDVGNYMGHMALALGKLTNLEGFVRQVSTSHYSPSLPISKTHGYIKNSRNTPLPLRLSISTPMNQNFHLKKNKNIIILNLVQIKGLINTQNKILKEDLNKTKRLSYKTCQVKEEYRRSP